MMIRISLAVLLASIAGRFPVALASRCIRLAHAILVTPWCVRVSRAVIGLALVIIRILIAEVLALWGVSTPVALATRCFRLAHAILITPWCVRVSCAIIWIASWCVRIS